MPRPAIVCADIHTIGAARVPLRTEPPELATDLGLGPAADGPAAALAVNGIYSASGTRSMAKT
jgi:hypothetical protein